MQLISNIEPKERPANFDIALRLLHPVLRQRNGHYEHWFWGRWVPIDLDGIMREANKIRKRSGQPQFNGKPEWLQ